MYSLRIKTPLVIVGISLLSVALSAFFASWLTVRAFDEYAWEQMRDDFIGRVTNYYQANHTWEGVLAILPRPDPIELPIANGTDGSTKPTDLSIAPPANFALLDLDGCVVVPAAPYRFHDCSPAKTSHPRQDVLLNGRVIATAIIVGNRLNRNRFEDAYIQRINRAFRWGAFGSAALAILLGVLISRWLTQPLLQLTQAVRRMAAGEMPAPVALQRGDELGELAQAFNLLGADLAHANQARRQMTADVAHELRNPLMVMIGYLEAMRDNVLKPTPERIEMMYNDALHLKRLVADLSTLSLADAGQLSLHLEPTAPEELIVETVQRYQAQAAQKEIQLACDLDERLSEIQVDPERMVQVLNNLVSNALRYTPNHGCITLAAHQSKNQVQLSIADTGQGIPPDALPYVFERFYQADSARSEPLNRQPEGSAGLGLAIAKSLITAQGGTIEVESVVGQGTRFVMTFVKE